LTRIGKSALKRQTSSKITTNTVVNKSANAMGVLKKAGKRLCNNNFKKVEFKTAHNKSTGQYVVMAHSPDAEAENSYLILTSAKTKSEADTIIQNIKEGMN
jgi:hypothetical protein